jgi:hypothetical protein
MLQVIDLVKHYCDVLALHRCSLNVPSRHQLGGLSAGEAAAAVGRWMERLGLVGREDSHVDRPSHGKPRSSSLPVQPGAVLRDDAGTQARVVP